MGRKLFHRIPLEAIVWIIGLALLFTTEPSSENHFTICPLAHLGFEFCPGCGLGKSISYLFAGDFHRSFESHPLGLLALSVLLFRIFNLLKNNSKIYGQNY